MANNLTLASPEIQATIKWLREKNGVDKKVEKTLAECQQMVKDLHKKIKELEKSEERNETAYWRESERIENCLRLLTTIHNRYLKKAVSLILYWDKFSWLNCDIIERMRTNNPRIKAFLDLPRDYGNVRVMEKYIGTKEFADAIRIFGYGDEADKRTDDKADKKSKSKSKAKAKKSTSKKGSK